MDKYYSGQVVGIKRFGGIVLRRVVVSDEEKTVTCV
jgi:hypothetical protein